MALSTESEFKASNATHLDAGAHAPLGQISFINTLPIVVPLASSSQKNNCTQIFGTPAELNEKLRSGALQLGAMSSIYFIEDGGFQLFPEISISGTGKVGSVLLFSKDSLDSLDGKIIDVPSTSATSIKLLQLLLKEEYGAEPKLRQAKQDAQSNARAFLLIGDQALKYDDAYSQDMLRIDLAQWWFKRFSLPFVFGVWGARKNWAQKYSSRFEEISNSLREACDLGLSSMLPGVIREAQSRTHLNAQRLSSYYQDELDYRLTEHHTQALELFGNLCRKQGLIRQV